MLSRRHTSHIGQVEQEPYEERRHQKFDSFPALPVDGLSVSRAEYEISLDVFGFVEARVVAGKSTDAASLSSALDGFAPDWREDDCSALRGAVYLAASDRRRVAGLDREREDADATVLAMCRLYDATRLKTRMHEASS